MSKQTWICMPCRKAYLRKKSLASVECPSCHGPCERVHWSTRVPSPKETKAWEKFVADHKASKAQMESYARVEQGSREVSIKGSPAAKRVPYLEAICRPLIGTLSHAAALPTNQLAGHAANVDFWVGEASHCLAVIDGYRERFDRLRAGQAEYEKRHTITSGGPPLRRGAKDHGQEELRRAVCEAIERFLTRCHREALLSEKTLRASLRVVGAPVATAVEANAPADGGRDPGS